MVRSIMVHSQCANSAKEGTVNHKLLDTNAATHEAPHVFPPCKMCKQAHSIMCCPNFKALKITDWAAFVCTHNLCSNCLRDNHSVT